MPHPKELSYSECEAMLRAGVAGRVAVSAQDGPHILPINYSVVDGAIVIRTSTDSLLGRLGCGVTVAFEVDHFDYHYQRGCSVVARGVTEAVEDPAEVARIRSVWEPRPWASGTRSLLLKLPWTELSGRQLGAGWNPMSELPVRRTV
jgi:nitroimidazol reductase NimA-like FMN-containing flavoprotein (pyridoxamine 5'-phosphate oxidase superfamily)